MTIFRRSVALIMLLAVTASSVEVVIGAEPWTPFDTTSESVIGPEGSRDAESEDDCACLCACLCTGMQLVVGPGLMAVLSTFAHPEPPIRHETVSASRAHPRPPLPPPLT